MWLVFIGLALLVGFALGAILAGSKSSFPKRVYKLLIGRSYRSNRRYYETITRLLRDQNDEAIDSFIGSMQVNDNTLETHLALGALHRKRGEFDRAVRVHENLLQHPNLKNAQRDIVKCELAQNYLYSGLLDRAETLLLELRNSFSVERNIRDASLRYLVELYQDSKEWLSAIDVADELTTTKFSGNVDHWRKLQAQFCCELAETFLKKPDCESADKWLRRALAYDPSCARAYLIAVKKSLAGGNLDATRSAAMKLANVCPSYLPTMLLELEVEIAETLGDKLWLQELNQYYTVFKSLVILKSLIIFTQKVHGVGEAFILCLNELGQFPRYKVYTRLIRSLIETSKAGDSELYEKMLAIVEQLLKENSGYQCGECGFNSAKLNWFCPSCKSWASAEDLSPSYT